MPLPAIVCWTVPIGLGVGAGIIAALAIHREEVEDFLEDATLSVMEKVSIAIEERKARRRDAVLVPVSNENEKSGSDDLFPGTATLSGATCKDEKEDTSKGELTRRKPHGLNREDIDHWIMSQGSEETSFTDQNDETSSTASSEPFTPSTLSSE
ncbi:DEKNAAC101378 [Brettanomyces naardenensis]|uniref:DEKNAAC101378 n=1 Tax=Brettanomyces naardenensis TaxID=13370 RepID=A0A448YHL4_BRENA|nr:DEKNAAC101378 [Brettanomyces naardenensis]